MSKGANYVIAFVQKMTCDKANEIGSNTRSITKKGTLLKACAKASRVEATASTVVSACGLLGEGVGRSANDVHELERMGEYAEHEHRASTGDSHEDGRGGEHADRKTRQRLCCQQWCFSFFAMLYIQHLNVT